jgi:uncharacterized protein (UPF0548 family)
MRLEELTDRSLTYDAVGATRRRATPAGFHPAEHRARLGRGPTVFRRASEALMTWRMHDAAGVRTEATGRAAPGVDSLGRLGVGRISISIPCRVVWTVEEPDRTGFGYGTLPGHPEVGEEAFLLERVGDDVVLTVRAFSRPAAWYARLGAPLTRAAQRLFMRRYARALRRLATD